MTDLYRIVALSLFLAPGLALAAELSPYSGEEMRAIKSLSASEVESLRRGDGMGFAKLAELNHYPGPKHVLAMADKLQLNATQLATSQELYETMQTAAIAIGEQLLAAEARLDAAFAKQTVSPQTLRDALLQIGELGAQLRYVHLVAHLQQKALLTEQQNRQYDTLRGYHDAAH